MKNAKMLMIALAAVLVLSLVGCSSAPAASASPEVSASAEATPVPTPEITMTAQEIADDLMNIDDLFSSMDHGEQDLFAEMCGLDLSMLEDYSLNDAMMNVKSHTLYIAKVKDAADMDAVKTAFQTRKEQMEQSFERYLEDQYEIAKAGQIVTSGNWVMLVICEDSPKVVDRFNELMGA